MSVCYLLNTMLFLLDEQSIQRLFQGILEGYFRRCSGLFRGDFRRFLVVKERKLFLARCLAIFFKTIFLARVLTRVFPASRGGKLLSYSIQNYRDGKMQCTVLLGRKNLLRRLMSKHNLNFLNPAPWASRTKPFEGLTRRGESYDCLQLFISGSGSRWAPAHFFAEDFL